MTDLSPGIYERLITNELQIRLAQLDPALVDRDPLDPADAYEVLARHLEMLTRRALRSIAGDDAEALADQVALANRIADAIVALAPGTAGVNDLVSETSDMLQAIVAPSGTPGPVQFPERPEVPLSVSALLVNGRDQ